MDVIDLGLSIALNGNAEGAATRAETAAEASEGYAGRAEYAAEQIIGLNYDISVTGTKLSIVGRSGNNG